MCFRAICRQVQKAGIMKGAFQIIFSHTVKTIVPPASFLIKNLASENIFLHFLAS